jgi:acyl carrier protein
MSDFAEGDPFRFLRARLADRLRVRPETIQPGTRMAEDLGLDSVTAVELLIEVEERFHLTITDQEVARLDTVGDAASFIAERRSSA